MSSTLSQQADHETNTPEVNSKLEKLYYNNYIRLGGSSIDVYLEDSDYTIAWEFTVDTYREMSEGSVYRAWSCVELIPEVQQYVLDEKVDNIVKIWRSRGLFGGQAGGTGSFESFGAATANTLLRGGIGQNGAAFDLVSYDFVLQYQETLDRLFARELHFVWRPENNSVYITQVPNQREFVLMECSVLKSYNELLEDHFARRWLQEYHLAEMKTILGRKYSMFATLPGAQGGSVMDQGILQEGMDKKLELENDLLLYADNGGIPQVIRG